jgi:hypothetical protein
VRIAIGKTYSGKFIIKRSMGKKLNPFRVAIGRHNNWIEFGICFGKYKRLRQEVEVYKQVNRWLFSQWLLNGTRRNYLITRLISFEFSHEVRQ